MTSFTTSKIRPQFGIVLIFRTINPIVF